MLNREIDNDVKYIHVCTSRPINLLEVDYVYHTTAGERLYLLSKQVLPLGFAKLSWPNAETPQTKILI